METLNDALLAHVHAIAICRHCRHRQPVNLARIAHYAGNWVPWFPQKGVPHFTDRLRCPACGGRGMVLWPSVVKLEPAKAEIPNYRVLDWGTGAANTRFDQLATAGNLMVARGAYNAAAVFYPDRRITLQQGAFVVADSREHGVQAELTPERVAEMREAEAWLGGGSLGRKTE